LNLRRIALHFAFASILILTAAVAAVGIDYVMWAIYVDRLEGREKPKTDEITTVPHVSPSTLRRLGRVFTERKSSFVNFDRLKPPGVIRIGAFGDSFTYGDEVDDGSDYPAQLQRSLTEFGIANVEVLNFGTSWFSFGQSHIMWNEVGRNFNLDYVLLGPAGFNPERDTEFNHTYGRSPYYLHSRYVLDDGGVRLIDVPGETHSERFRNYYSFVPHHDILRYDRSDPAFVAALLPGDKQLGNPFYYDMRSRKAEATAIQKYLLQSMKKSGTPILAAVYPTYNNVKRAADALTGENFCIAQFKRPSKFPYLAPEGHNSPTGNALLARQFLATLLGHPIDAPVVQTADIDEKARMPVVNGTLPAFDSARIKLNGLEAAIFNPLSPAYAGRKAPSFLKDGQVKSLIGLKAAGSSLLDGVFIALPTDVSATAPLRIVMESARSSEIVELGRLRPLVAGLNLGRGDLPNLQFRRGDFGGYDIILSTSGWAKMPREGSKYFFLRVMIGDKVILEGAQSNKPGKFVLRPLDGELLNVRGLSNGDLAIDHGGDRGDIVIELVRNNNAYSIPIARWWIEQQQLEPAPECVSLRPLTDFSKTTPRRDKTTVLQ
jgi:hypothetical protein